MKKQQKNSGKRKEREFITSISVFLLGREELKNQFWNIKSVKYNHATQSVNIGISTIDGKLGTTLQKLRKSCKDLSEYLYEQGLTFRKTHINFFVDKNDNEVVKVENFLEKIEIKNNQ